VQEERMHLSRIGWENGESQTKRMLGRAVACNRNAFFDQFAIPILESCCRGIR
jgi:hypothetical protein